MSLVEQQRGDGEQMSCLKADREQAVFTVACRLGFTGRFSLRRWSQPLVLFEQERASLPQLVLTGSCLQRVQNVSGVSQQPGDHW